MVQSDIASIKMTTRNYIGNDGARMSVIDNG